MVGSRVFVTRRIPDAGLDMLVNECDAEVWAGDGAPPRELLLEKVAGVEGILSMLSDRIDGRVMDAAGSGLKVISNYAVGYDNIDVAEATSRGILVGNTPGVLTETTADAAWALILGGARRLGEAHDHVRQGRWVRWEPMGLLGLDVHGATLGIVGMGAIGKAVASRARGFSMKVIYHDHKGREELGKDVGARLVPDLDTLLASSDIVSLHCPLTEGTRGLIGDRELSLMKSTGILVNTARGPVVDTGALYRALRDGEIAYAALDVTDPEPINMDNPLLTVDNCLVLPHIGSASVATRSRMAEMAAANLLAGLRGELPPYCVNPPANGP